MKKIKYIFSLVALLALAISCTVEGISDDTSSLGSVVSPTDVVGFYNVTQDNTGLVTITPNGEGAVSYDIYYGDITASPVNVGQGKSTSHIYAEGTYSVKIVAIGLTGLKTEVTQSLVVSFKAPENLEVEIKNDAAISKKVNVTASADFATMFDVYFGEAGNDVPVSANIDGTASYTYKTAGTYTIRVVAKGAGIKTTEETKSFDVTAILQPTVSAPMQPIRQASDVISIYSGAYANVAGSNFNPNWGQSGTYAEYDLNGDKILNYINLSYQGIDIGSSIDASSMEFLHIDIWSADNTSIDIFPLPSGVIPADERHVTKTLIANQWNSFDIPLSDFTSQGLPLDNLKQFKFVGNPSGKTVFIDNLYFYKGAAQLIALPLDFESATLTYAWGGFGNADASIVTNPDKSGVNVSNNVLKIEKKSGAEVWAGAFLSLESTFDFSKGTTVKVNVWSPKVGADILYKMEVSTNSGVFVEVHATTTVANKWEVLSFDLSSVAASGIEYGKVILFPDFGQVGTGAIYYFDDIKQSN